MQIPPQNELYYGIGEKSEFKESQKKHNDTHRVVAMTTVMPLVLF